MGTSVYSQVARLQLVLDHGADWNSFDFLNVF